MGKEADMAKRKKKKSWDPRKATKAAARKAHFEAGGTLAMWRGAAHTFTDRKKAANKNACRGKVM